MLTICIITVSSTIVVISITWEDQITITILVKLLLLIDHANAQFQDWFLILLMFMKILLYSKIIPRCHHIGELNNNLMKHLLNGNPSKHVLEELAISTKVELVIHFMVLLVHLLNLLNFWLFHLMKV